MYLVLTYCTALFIIVTLWVFLPLAADISGQFQVLWSHCSTYLLRNPVQIQTFKNIRARQYTRQPIHCYLSVHSYGKDADSSDIIITMQTILSVYCMQQNTNYTKNKQRSFWNVDL